MSWEPVIGLEIHTQLATTSKLFSGAPTTYGAAPNTQACAIDIALPGVLPVLNREAVALAVTFGLAIGATINRRSVFARKNYFYPDLPKGYQISQYEIPIVGRGTIEITSETGDAQQVRITRAHLEEDAGKSLHEDFHGQTGIDLNRAGTPLIEIVTEPDLRSAADAAECMRRIHALVRYLGISDGNMQEGSFRCDANVSLRPAGSDTLGTRAEIKNLNSFRFLERAINVEIQRQAELLDTGQAIVQETRLYDPDRDETRAMRTKEEANDYRYFPDPDLPPLVVEAAWIEALRAGLPELPDTRRDRFVAELNLKPEDAAQIAGDRETADYFEAVLTTFGEDPRLAANWVVGELAGALNRADLTIENSPISADQLAGLLILIAEGTISGKIAKEVFTGIWDGEGSAAAIVEARGLKQISDSGELEVIVEKVVADNPDQAEQFRAGKEKLMGFFVGQVMKATGGKANPKQVNQLLREKL